MNRTQCSPASNSWVSSPRPFLDLLVFAVASLRMRSRDLSLVLGYQASHARVLSWAGGGEGRRGKGLKGKLEQSNTGRLVEGRRSFSRVRKARTARNQRLRGQERRPRVLGVSEPQPNVGGHWSFACSLLFLSLTCDSQSVTAVLPSH